jgi:hypothetical protein
MVKKRKTQTKGVRYIAEKLNKYFVKKYPTKKGALPKAKEILETLKSKPNKEEQKVTIKNISKLIREPRDGRPKKGEAPKLFRELAVEQDYYELSNYPEWIQKTTNEIWFNSTISPDGLPMIQGGSVVKYEEYFKSFMDYANEMIALTEGNMDSANMEYKVVCTKPNNKNARKRWESEILSIGSDGIQYNFGYDPKNPNFVPTMVEMTPKGRDGSRWDEESKETPPKTPKEPKGKKLPKPKKEPKGKTPKKPKGKPDSDAKIKVELKRLNIVEQINELYLKGLIDKEEYLKRLSKYE